MSKKLILCTISAAMSFCFIYFGCGNDETIIQQQTLDTNVVIYDSIDVFEFFTQSSLSGVDLLKGVTTTAADTSKDMQLVDSNGLGIDFHFRSGDQSLNPILSPGRETWFNTFSQWTDLTKSQFDTISVIPDSNPTLDSLDFTQNDTKYWGYFQAPLISHTAYAFYLKGKYAWGYTPKRVFGVFWLREGVSGGPNGARFNIAVKINKASQNKFVR